MSLFVIMIYIDLINIDDGTQGGVLSDVLHDVEVIKKEAGIVVLDLNPQKSEVISINPDLIATVYLGYMWLIKLMPHYWVHQLEILVPSQ